MTDDNRTLEDLVKGVRVAMLTFDGPRGLESRPLTVQRVEDGTVSFLVGDDTEWLPADGTAANLAFVDDKLWVSTTGTTTTTKDPATLEALGDPISDLWFTGETGAVALAVRVDHGDWWTAPGFLQTAVKLAAAKAAGEPPEIGDEGSVAV